ncbi:cytidine and dCMP deaminase domain-containing 1-like, partial [Paramuricea clavata]
QLKLDLGRQFQLTFHRKIPNFVPNFANSLPSSKVHNEIHKQPIKCPVYKPICEFHYELLNLATNLRNGTLELCCYVARLFKITSHRPYWQANLHKTSNTEALSVADQNGIENAPTDSYVENVNPTHQTSTDQTPAKNDKKKKPYAKSYPRVSKENLYMIIALWMEDFVDEAPKDHKKVGAVLVLPNDVVLAADCSRDGVHAVARLLMKHYDKAKGCKMFMSRKPCPFCAKLLVQSKVERVLFLPFEPEYYHAPKLLEPDTDGKTPEEIKKINYNLNKPNRSKMKQVDMLFTASPIAQTQFVLQVEKDVLKRAKRDTPKKDIEIVNDKKEKFIEKYSAFDKKSKWMEHIKEDLPWPVFDKNIGKKVRRDFRKVMKWIARVLVIPQSQSKPERARGLNFDFELCEISKEHSNVFNPVNEETVKQVQQVKQAKYLIEIARFLATRTDDPTTGVGAVIVNPEMQILALGWNGFPLKAHYGEFGRGSDKDKSDKKYPYVIHAEQNALLMRNNKNIEGSILFVTRPPCNECAPLIAMEGVKIVVVDSDVVTKKFPEMVKDGQFVCYQTKKQLPV